MTHNIENALSFIPADSREICIKIGMAVHNEVGEAGYQLWDEWLQSGDNYNQRDMHSVWKSFKPGSIGIGTLFHEAKQNGYSPEKSTLSVSEIEQRKLERQALHIKAEEERVQEQTKVAEQCRSIWESVSPVTEHPYLTKKQVKGFGLKQSRGNLIIPVRKDKQITSLQSITPTGEKLFHIGGSVSGGYHVIGKPGNDPILIGEGYATLASAYEATSFCSVVSFNSGNLRPVAETIRSMFPDTEIIILADNDQWTDGNPGVAKATEAAKYIDAYITTPQFKDTDSKPTDFNDLHCAEGLDEVNRQILNVLEAQPETESKEPTTESPEEAIQRLSKLSPLDYEAVRKDEAKNLGFRPNVLDKAVEDARPEIEEGQSTGGREVVFDDCEKHPDEVIGHEVLDETLHHITRHMHINLHDAVICALWAAHTHIYSKFNHTPRLIISAPEPECGKTVLLFHMVGNFSNKVLPTDNLSPAVFFRLAEKYECSFLIDEGDVFLQQDSDLIAGFNNGFEPHGGVYRCVGDDHEVRKFPTFAPLALAGIQLEKKLPPATRSRGFVIHLERVGDEISEQDAWDKDIHRAGLLNTRKKIARWMHDNSRKISLLKPALPKGLKNRSKDKWTPLFSIAQIAGGKWPDKALDAYNKSIRSHEPTKSEQFLIDVQSVLQGTVDIHTETLIEKLCEMEDSRYKEYNFKAFDRDKKKIQSIQISKILSKYKVKPKNVTVFGSQKKGYSNDALQKVFARYIPNKPVLMEEKFNTSLNVGNLAVHPSDSNDTNGCSDILPVRTDYYRTDKNSLKAKPSNGSDGRTGKLPTYEENKKNSMNRTAKTVLQNTTSDEEQEITKGEI